MLFLQTWFNQLLAKLNLLPNTKLGQPTKAKRKRGRKNFHQKTIHFRTSQHLATY